LPHDFNGTHKIPKYPPAKFLLSLAKGEKSIQVVVVEVAEELVEGEAGEGGAAGGGAE